MNTWSHVAFVSDGANTTIYVNGVVVKSGALTLNAGNTTGEFIGSSSSNGSSPTSPFNGLLDDVRVYNRALSPAEIKDIYDAGIYTRYFYLDSAGRDGSGNILSSGGTNDPSTEKATVVYGWAGGSTSSFSTYLTRFRDNIFDQTDWSGGPGQDGPVTSTNSMFSTSTSMFYATTTGSLMIQLP